MAKPELTMKKREQAIVRLSGVKGDGVCRKNNRGTLRHRTLVSVYRIAATPNDDIFSVDARPSSGYDKTASGWSGDRGPVFTGSRKVRTPQSTASDSTRGGETPFGVNLPEKGHRNKLPSPL